VTPFERHQHRTDVVGEVVGPVLAFVFLAFVAVVVLVVAANTVDDCDAKDGVLVQAYPWPVCVAKVRP
jgi:hypothetical protein